ncbi:MAG: ATP-grasp domain-containing protein [Bacteroidales bacterium]|nr:ATP-grasp domain-containing protein [Bacteroidales bacterium]MCF8389285.1 ATP-grasp domain-containing protein [Bacteroidales bacterium]
MEIKSILIANRGEIAVRVINTARMMGIATWVIKTAKEPNAYYLTQGDHIIDFTERTEEIAEFLDIEAIVKAIKDNNISAVHPGYGFLAESPVFAKRCAEEKIIYIGPSSEAIFKMGNKTIAKQLAREHKVPLLGGSKGNLASPEEAVKIANEIGYPVILKAASGGGGRGMRIVEEEKSIAKMFKMASSEAEKAFNDPDVFVEKYVRNPRHIEFQIFGDQHGNIIHLGERECSVQRKHQKLIEESPSAALDENLRKKMGEAAINIAKSVNYFSAGTVEFLLDDDMKFYFMEMNTRIQVEHPVTEMITGLDLIEWQIRIARGEKLPLKQSEVKINGWAFEFRINAEDVQSGFSPSLGIIEKISLPRSKNIRIDTGVVEGSRITPYFDSMVAKLIVHGETREKAILYSQNALKKLWIKGLKTTIPFCNAVLLNKNFRKGKYDTSFLTKEMTKHYHEGQDDEMLAAFFATYDFVNEVEKVETKEVDFDKGKNIAPWVLKKRLKSL